MSGTGKTRNVSILGSTGSIGTQTLEVVSLHEDRLKVVALTANENVDRLEEQVRRYRPVMAGMVSEAAAGELKRRLAGINMEVLGGKDCLLEASVHPEADTVLNAVGGSGGLPPGLGALERGK